MPFFPRLRVAVATLLSLLCTRGEADGATSVIGINGRGFVVLAGEASFRRGSMVISRDSDPITRLGPRALLASCGEVSSGGEFSSYVARSLALDSIIRGRPSATSSAAHFIRRELARLLRRAPVQADFLLAGVDVSSPWALRSDGSAADGGDDESLLASSSKPQLHWIDRTGSEVQLEYAVQGPGAAMLLALLDERWEPGLSLDQVLDLVRACVRQLSNNLAVACPGGWRVHVIDREGSREVLSIDAGGKKQARKGGELAPVDEW